MGAAICASLQSILDQQGVDFEFLVIDDGSTDATPAILAEFLQRDSRLRVFRQENQGLTFALVRGCGEARGPFIARHDADDLSLPGRLSLQAELLQKEPRLAMLSCWTRTIGPEDELLLETSRPTDYEECTRLLTGSGVGPYHGSVMFRNSDYHRVGGYRPAFRFTQDWDLWLRLVDVGLLGYVSTNLYAFRIRDASISTHRRGQQTRLHVLARQCWSARRAGQSEQPWLDEVARVCRERPPVNRRGSAESAYFIGKCLLDRRDRRALPYLHRSVRRDPWRWRHWAALAAAAFLCRPASPSPEAPARALR